MIQFFRNIINLGVSEDKSLFELRKIRLVNSFSLIAAGLMILFSGLNLSIGAYIQALLIFSGCLFIAIPSIYLNKIGKHDWAKYYFIGLGLIFIDLVTFRAVFNFQNRYNEVFLIGFSTLTVVLLENPAKSIFFIFIALSTLAMITVRQLLADLPITNDIIMAYMNTLVAYSCIYFFINIFKKEQLRSVEVLEHYSKELEEKEKEIIKQRDEIFANRLLLRSTLDSLPLFISMLDMDGKFLIANSKYEKALKKPISEIEGRHYRELLPSDMMDTHESHIIKGLAGETIEFEDTTSLKSGRLIHSIGKYIPIFDAHNNQVALAIYVVDITKLKQTEAELISLNDTKNKLLSIISHDIRSPLNSLKGLLSITSEMDESTFETYTAKIATQLEVVTFSLDNMLNWAKTQMDGFSINPEEVSLNKLIDDCLPLFEERIKEKNIVIVPLKQKDLNVYVDPESLKLVIRNVLSNALKYTPNEGKIELDVVNDYDQLILNIIDNGIGISDENIKQLNEGITSVSSRKGTNGEKGTGLGLSLSIEILNKNNGELKLARNKVGTTAQIILPKKG